MILTTNHMRFMESASPGPEDRAEERRGHGTCRDLPGMDTGMQASCNLWGRAGVFEAVFCNRIKCTCIHTREHVHICAIVCMCGYTICIYIYKYICIHICMRLYVYGCICFIFTPFSPSLPPCLVFSLVLCLCLFLSLARSLPASFPPLSLSLSLSLSLCFLPLSLLPLSLSLPLSPSLSLVSVFVSLPPSLLLQK